MTDYVRTPSGIASAQAFGTPTTFEQYRALHAFGSLRVEGKDRPNLVPNPCAAQTITGWTGYGGEPISERVTSAPYTIPGGTAIHAPIEDDGCYLTIPDPLPLSEDLSEGSLVAFQMQVLVAGAVAGEVELDAEVQWYDDAHELVSWDSLCNEEFWSSNPYDPYLVEFPLPQDGWARLTATLSVPADATHFGLTLFPYDATGGSGHEYGCELWVTQVLVEEGVESGYVAPYGTSDAKLTVEYPDYVALRATGGIGIGTEDPTMAWLVVSAPGYESMVAHGVIHTGSRARMHHVGDTHRPILTPPAMPVVTLPDIRGLRVTLDGWPLKRAHIRELTIELSPEGGPVGATMAVANDLKRAPKMLSRLLVRYKGQTLFRGRLETISGDVSSDLSWDMTFGGPLVALRDHKGYRAVFRASDLQEWQTDQGPRSSPDTFEVVSKASQNQ